MRIYQMPIHRNLILEILRNRNEDRILRIEGIPDDAQVRGAEMVDGEHLVLYVESSLEIKDDTLHVAIRDKGSVYVNGEPQPRPGAHPGGTFVTKFGLGDVVRNEASRMTGKVESIHLAKGKDPQYMIALRDQQGVMIQGDWYDEDRLILLVKAAARTQNELK